MHSNAVKVYTQCPVVANPYPQGACRCARIRQVGGCLGARNVAHGAYPPVRSVDEGVGGHVEPPQVQVCGDLHVPRAILQRPLQLLSGADVSDISR